MGDLRSWVRRGQETRVERWKRRLSNGTARHSRAKLSARFWRIAWAASSSARV